MIPVIVKSIFLSLLFFANFAQAQIIFSPSASYLDQKADDGTGEQTAKLTIIDLRLGYVMDMGLYLGGLYSIQDQDLLSDSSDSYFGPSVGYYNSGFMIVGTYYIYGERDFTSGNTKLTNVDGYQLDISYSVPVAENILLGPQLTYQSLKFSEAEVAGISQSADYTFTGVSPYFNLTFIF